MNRVLTEEIIYHTFASFGILQADFIDINFTKSLIDPQFVLRNKLSFETENGIIVRNIYGCQIISADSKALKILVGDCSIDKNIQEYCLLLHLQDSPAYGSYLCNNRNLSEKVPSEAMIAVSMDNKNWMPCNTYLSATYLAGLERLKDLGLSWSVCQNYEDQHKMLLSFLDFHSMFFGGGDAGEEV